MANIRVREILDQVKAFHRHLAQVYRNLGEEAAQARVKMLLEYMAAHERRLETSLAEYEKGAAEEILDTWFEFTPDLSRCERLETVSLHPEMTVDDVTQAVLSFDRCLGEYYKQLAELSPLPAIGELFDNLMTQEESEGRDAARAALSVDEI